MSIPDAHLTRRRQSSHGMVLLCLLLLAAFLRLWQLADLPPGLYFDEAFNGVDALTILDDHQFPLYFPANNGREPLFIYLCAIFVHFLGSKAYALRLCAAFVGILTVPILYFGAKTILAPQAESTPKEQTNPCLTWFPLIAAAVLALSFWHLSLSRLAFRVILLPALSTLALTYFWRGWTRGTCRDYAWAGCWLAATLYTYIGARLLPLVMVLFILFCAFSQLFDSRLRRQGWWPAWQARSKGLLIMTAVAGVAALPFFYAIYQDPTIISARAADVSVFNDKPLQVLNHVKTNVIATILGFYTQGEHLNPRHNLPGRPVLDWPLALFFTIGWLVALWNWRDRRYRLIIIWFVIMLAPTYLSIDAPHTLRSAGALPPFVLLIALGLQTTIDQIHVRRHSRAFSGIVVVAILGLSGAATVYDYFYRWAQLPILGVVFEAELQRAAEQTVAQLANSAPEQGLLLSRRLFLSPQMRFAMGTMPQQELPQHPARALTPTTTNFLVEEHAALNQLTFLLHRSANRVIATWLTDLPQPGEPPLLAQLQTFRHQWLTSPIHQSDWPRVLWGQATLTAATMKPQAIHYPLNLTFANGIQLLGYDMLSPRDTQLLLLRTYWRQLPEATPLYATNLRLFSHLLIHEQQQQLQYGELGGNYPVGLWTDQQIVDDQRLFSFDPVLQGKAYIELGLYYTMEGVMKRVNIIDGNGNVAADQVILGATWVGAPPPPLPLADFTPLQVHFAERLELVGWQWRQSPAADALTITLVWRALDRMPTGYTTFVHLLDATGQMVAQYDQPPGGVDNPTSLWAPGEEALTVHQLTLPPGSDLSQLALRIGLYEPVSGQQLPISAAAPAIAATEATYLLLKLK